MTGTSTANPPCSTIKDSFGRVITCWAKSCELVTVCTQSCLTIFSPKLPANWADNFKSCSGVIFCKLNNVCSVQACLAQEGLKRCKSPLSSQVAKPARKKEIINEVSC